MLNALTVGRLLARDARLQKALDELQTAWFAVNTKIEAVLIALGAGNASLTFALAGEVAASWEPFDNYAANLHDVALDRLVPTLVAGQLGN